MILQPHWKIRYFLSFYSKTLNFSRFSLFSGSSAPETRHFSADHSFLERIRIKSIIQ